MKTLQITCGPKGLFALGEDGNVYQFNGDPLGRPEGTWEALPPLPGGAAWDDEFKVLLEHLVAEMGDKKGVQYPLDRIADIVLKERLFPSGVDAEGPVIRWADLTPNEISALLRRLGRRVGMRFQIHGKWVEFGKRSQERKAVYTVKVLGGSEGER